MKEEDKIMKQNEFIMIELMIVVSLVLMGVSFWHQMIIEACIGIIGVLCGVIYILVYVIDRNNRIISKISK